MLTDETVTNETLTDETVARQRRHFETLFSGDADPWGYRTRFSEQRRHSLVLSMLDRPAYGNAFEPGCANCVLSTLLAGRCTRSTILKSVTIWPAPVSSTVLCRRASEQT